MCTGIVLSHVRVYRPQSFVNFCTRMPTFREPPIRTRRSEWDSMNFGASGELESNIVVCLVGKARRV
jgi:hypothetical protein